ncbi:MAG TPA: hypothetical protein VGC62_24735 [Pseudomonas sp.]
MSRKPRRLGGALEYRVVIGAAIVKVAAERKAFLQHRIHVGLGDAHRIK